jgi:hypothetical protein
MPRAFPLQPSLNSGEFSPRMAARTDFAKYPLACATLENMIPLPQGGATRRPGTRFVVEIKDSSKKPRLIPFEFSEEQAYIIEAGEGYFRFCKDHGQIVAEEITASITNGTFSGSISGWTDQSGASSSISHDATNDRLNLTSNGTTNAHAEQEVANALVADHTLTFRVIGAPGDKVKMRVGTTSTGAEIVDDHEFGTGYHTFTFSAMAANFFVQFLHTAAKTIQIDDVAMIDNGSIELTTPYLETDLPTLNFAQSADVLYIAHSSYPVYRLERSSHTSWSLTEVAFDDGPYLRENTTDTTLTPSANTGFGITITASAAEGINDGDGFQSTDVGRLIRYKKSNDWGTAIITGVNSTTVVNVDVTHDFETSPNAQKTWRLGAWSGTTGYPGKVYFFEQRLGFAKTTNQPQTFWLSQSADFENMTPDNRDGDNDGTVEDDDAIDYTISADQVNAIRWMVAYKNLIIGTAGGEWTVKSSGSVLTPTDVDVKRQTGYGSANNDPQLMRGRLVYLQKARRKILEFAFDLELDGFQSLDMTLLADHVTRGGIESMAYQQELDSTLWCVRADGVLPTFTYQPDQNVIGWARQILGGSFESGSAVAESVAVIPGVNRDETWLAVKRTIDGEAKRYLEFVEAPYDTSEDQSDAFYVDCGLTYDGAPTSSISGLGHLEGETIKVLADGSVHADCEVSGGAITLQSAASKVQAGLGYGHVYQSLKWEAGSPAGTAQGQTKRIDGVTLMLMDALNAKVGPSVENLNVIPFREIDDQMDTAVPLYTGEKFIEFDGNYETDTRVWIEGDDPLPFTLLAVSPRIKTNAK